MLYADACALVPWAANLSPTMHAQVIAAIVFRTLALEDGADRDPRASELLALGDRMLGDVERREVEGAAAWWLAAQATNAFVDAYHVARDRKERRAALRPARRRVQRLVYAVLARGR